MFGAGYSSNGGWQFSYDVTDKLFIGALGDYSDPNATIQAFGRTLKVWALDADTGAVKWVVDGVDPWCVASTADGGAPVPALVWCRWDAATTLNRVVGSATTINAASVSVEGFAPETGKTLWTIPLGALHDQDYTTWVQSLRTADDHTLVVPAQTGPIQIDTQTGAAHAARSDLQLVCTADVKVQVAGKTWTGPDGRSRSDWTTGSSAQACDPSGKPVSLHAPWPTWVGATVGSIRVVTTPSGLQAVTS